MEAVGVNPRSDLGEQRRTMAREPTPASCLNNLRGLPRYKGSVVGRSLRRVFQVEGIACVRVRGDHSPGDRPTNKEGECGASCLEVPRARGAGLRNSQDSSQCPFIHSQDHRP